MDPNFSNANLEKLVISKIISKCNSLVNIYEVWF